MIMHIQNLKKKNSKKNNKKKRNEEDKTLCRYQVLKNLLFEYKNRKNNKINLKNKKNLSGKNVECSIIQFFFFRFVLCKRTLQLNLNGETKKKLYKNQTNSVNATTTKEH